jgi:hypothetical protein
MVKFSIVLKYIAFHFVMEFSVCLTPEVETDNLGSGEQFQFPLIGGGSYSCVSTGHCGWAAAQA